jgi:aromatic ring-opening dioxygenase LigB subunit
MCIPCVIPDLLLKHPDITVATYKRIQVKHVKQVSKTLTKTIEKHLKTIANICIIQMKHSQTYV